MPRIEGVAGQTDDRTKLLIRRIIAYTVLIILVFISLLPFYLLIINATRGKVQTGLRFFPESYLDDNIKTLTSDSVKVKYGSVVRAFLNSAFVSVSVTILSVYFSALTAYAIHVYDFKLKKAAHTFILIVMMVPTQSAAIGFYRMMKNMTIFGSNGLLDSYIPLIVPAVAAPGVYFFMIQYMSSSLPLEIVEAARIDGASNLQIYIRIALPLAKVGMVTIGLFTVLMYWNDYTLPLYLTTSSKLYTVQKYLYNMMSSITALLT